MNRSIRAKLARLLSRRELKEKLAKLAMILSCLAVFCVTYIMVSPVLTQEWPAVCGLEEHTHDESCYQVETVEGEPVLLCQYEEGHVHGEECYTETTVSTLVCALEEDESHTHGEECYVTETVRELTCTEPEGHVHDESCYGPGEPQEIRTLVCGLEEHTHTDACYNEPGKDEGPEYICGYLVEHEHTEECYFESGELKCTLPEHKHSEACLPEVPAEPEDFPQIVPEGYVPYIFDNGEGLIVESYAPEDAFQEPVSLDARVLEEDSGEYSQARDILLGTENYGEFDGMAALDIRFINDEGEELEPATGKVYVRINARAMLPEDATNVSIQHISDLRTEEEVVFVLAEEDPAAELIAPPEGIALMSEIEDFDMAEAPAEPTGAPTAEEMPLAYMVKDMTETTQLEVNRSEAGEGLMDLTAEFAVNSFSNFTITWSGNKNSAELKVVYAYYDGTMMNEVAGSSDINYNLSNNVPGGKNLDDRPDGSDKTLRELLYDNAPEGFNVEGLVIEVSDEKDKSGATYYTGVQNIQCYIYQDNNYGFYRDWMYMEPGSTDFKIWNTKDAVLYVVSTAGNQSINVIYAYDDGGKPVSLGEGSKSYEFPNGSSLDTVGSSGAALRETIAVTAAPKGFEFARFVVDTDGNGNYAAALNVKCDAEGVWRYQDEKGDWQEWTDGKHAVYAVSRYGPYNAVNFYVSVNVGSIDTDGNVDAPAGSSRWTGALSGTYVNAEFDGSVPRYYDYLSGNEFFVLGASGEKVTAKDDENIRSLGTGYTLVKEDGSSYTYTLEHFPTDEEILRQIRDSGMEINGVAKSELNTDTFTIRWVCFKFNADKSWHIDGVLCRKLGKLVIEKTFYGDEDAIKEVQEREDPSSLDKFSIAVTDANGKRTVHSLSDHNGGAAAYGGDGQTYIWRLDAQTNMEYTVQEQNYLSENPDIVTYAEWRVSNRPDGTDTGWMVGDGATVTAAAYAADQSAGFQTVHLRNGYLPENSITIFSEDSATMNGLPNVEYIITSKDGKATDVYTNGSGRYYLYDGGEGFTKVDTLTSDANGRLTIYGLANEQGGLNPSEGEYVLTETKVPLGYGRDTATFTVANTGAVTLTAGDPADVTLKPVQNKTYILTLPHLSKTMTVSAVKTWMVNPGEATPEVELQLYRNGTPVSTLTLNEENNWTGVFPGDWPVYTNGVLADYTVRESRIGDSYYEPAYGDGYAGYEVMYGWSYTTDEDGVRSGATVTVTNATAVGDVSFTKLDYVSNEPLQGAEFRLYSDPACTQPLNRTAVSDANGLVSFTGLPVGQYYMKESKAPSGYALPAKVYAVTVGADSSTITDVEDGSTVSTICNIPISSVELPATGGMGTHLLYTMGGMITLIALVLLVYSNKRKRGRDSV